MYYDEFVEKYIGMSIDYDGVYGVQCVDLIKLYLNKVFDIKAGSWGDAKYYWINFHLRKPLVNAFRKIKNTSNFVPQKGDICVWNKDVSQNNNSGHISIATGEGDKRAFYSYDQNWNGKPMKRVKHSYKNFYGVLRAKDQSKINGNNNYPKPVKWSNGSTKELVYSKSNLKGKIGTLFAFDDADCIYKVKNAYIVLYDTVAGYKKVGFVKYSGNAKNIESKYDKWQNGSTKEKVYSDTQKRNQIGTINEYEKCYCLGKYDGMYLVLYNIDNTDYKKVGFCDYKG